MIGRSTTPPFFESHEERIESAEGGVRSLASGGTQNLTKRELKVIGASPRGRGGCLGESHEERIESSKPGGALLGRGRLESHEERIESTLYGSLIPSAVTPPESHEERIESPLGGLGQEAGGGANLTKRELKGAPRLGRPPRA